MYQLSGKVGNSTFSAQICPKNRFRIGILENQSQNKKQHPRDLGLNFEKTNIKKRISTIEVLCVCVCVCVCVCQFLGKMNNFDFFGPNLLKNGFRVGNVPSFRENR